MNSAPRRQAVDGTKIRGSQSAHLSQRSAPSRPQHVPRNQAPGPLGDDPLHAPEERAVDPQPADPPQPLYTLTKEQFEQLLRERGPLPAMALAHDESPAALGPRVIQEQQQPMLRRRRPSSGPGSFVQERHPAPPGCRMPQYRSSDVPPREQWDLPPPQMRRQERCINTMWLIVQVCAAIIVIALISVAWTSPRFHAQMRQLFGGGSTGGGTMVPPPDLIPLWLQPHRTNASAVTQENTQPSMLWRVRQSLRYHLFRAQGKLPCLCMHHLDHSAWNNDALLPVDAKRNDVTLGTHLPYRRVCAVYNGLFTDIPRNQSAYCDTSKQIYFMVNPHPIGKSKNDGAQVLVDERSIACPHGTPATKRKRPRHYFVEWQDERANTLFAQFSDAHSVCLQLAMEEFVGNVECAEPVNDSSHPSATSRSTK